MSGASRWSHIARIGALTAAALAVNTALVMLPLLGVPGDWQLDDTTLAALTMLSVAAGAETATWLAYGEAATLSPGGFELTWINWTQGVGLLFVIQAALVCRVMTAPIPSAPALVSGTASMLGGAVLRSAAIRTLGAGFGNDAAPPRGFTYIDSGPYALVRHPAEIGLLMIVAGFLLMLQSWAVLVIAGLPVAAVSGFRVREEERARRVVRRP